MEEERKRMASRWGASAWQPQPPPFVLLHEHEGLVIRKTGGDANRPRKLQIFCATTERWHLDAAVDFDKIDFGEWVRFSVDDTGNYWRLVKKVADPVVTRRHISNLQVETVVCKRMNTPPLLLWSPHLQFVKCRMAPNIQMGIFYRACVNLLGDAVAEVKMVKGDDDGDTCIWQCAMQEDDRSNFVFWEIVGMLGKVADPKEQIHFEAKLNEFMEYEKRLDGPFGQLPVFVNSPASSIPRPLVMTTTAEPRELPMMEIDPRNSMGRSPSSSTEWSPSARFFTTTPPASSVLASSAEPQRPINSTNSTMVGVVPVLSNTWSPQASTVKAQNSIRNSDKFPEIKALSEVMPPLPETAKENDEWSNQPISLYASAHELLRRSYGNAKRGDSPHTAFSAPSISDKTGQNNTNAQSSASGYSFSAEVENYKKQERAMTHRGVEDYWASHPKRLPVFVDEEKVAADNAWDLVKGFGILQHPEYQRAPRTPCEKRICDPCLLLQRMVMIEKLGQRMEDRHKSQLADEIANHVGMEWGLR